MNYYRIVPSSHEKYRQLRDKLKQYYAIITVGGEWMAIRFNSNVSREAIEMDCWIIGDRKVSVTLVTEPIDQRDLLRAIDKKLRGRTEWSEIV